MATPREPYSWLTTACDRRFAARVRKLAHRLDRPVASVIRSALLAYLEDHAAGRKNERRPVVLFDPGRTARRKAVR